MLASSIFFSGCDDDDNDNNVKQTRYYSSEVARQWLDVQSDMLFVQSGNPFGFNPSRYMAYCGVALYESVLPGMPDYQTLHGQLTDMPAMPAVEPGADYHWPAAANAALATLTQKFFSVTAAYNEPAVLNLKNELNDRSSVET